MRWRKIGVLEKARDELGRKPTGSEWKLWIPQSLTHSLIERAHSDPKAGHGGMTKTLEILRRQFYWPGMTIQIRKHVRGREVCKESKALNFRMQVGIGRRVETDRPFQKLYIDFLGKYPRSKSGQPGYSSWWTTSPSTPS